MKWKRYLPLLLAAGMAVSAPVSAYAQEPAGTGFNTVEKEAVAESELTESENDALTNETGEKNEDFANEPVLKTSTAEEYFETEENPDLAGTVTITGYTGTDESVVIPAEIGGKTVTAIGDYAFLEHKEMKEVTFPDSLATIGESAFAGSGITKVTIPEGVKEIKEYAFEGCSSLTDVWFEGAKTALDGSGAFFPFNNKDVVFHGPCGSSAWLSAQKEGYQYEFTGGHTKQTEAAKKASMRTTSDGVITEDGILETKCSVCGQIEKTEPIAAPQTVTLSPSSFVYNGNDQIPQVTVTDANGQIIAAEHYIVEWPEDTRSVGSHEAVITFQGDYYFGHAYASWEITDAGDPANNVLGSSDDQNTPVSANFNPTVTGTTYGNQESWNGTGGTGAVSGTAANTTTKVNAPITGDSAGMPPVYGVLIAAVTALAGMGAAGKRIMGPVSRPRSKKFIVNSY